LNQTALRLAPSDDGWLRTLIVCNTLVVSVRRADPAVARVARSAAVAAQTAGNLRAAAACLAALAQDYERRTLMDSALATFDEVAALQRAARNFWSLAGTRQWQGYVLYALKGEYVAGRDALNESVALAARTGALRVDAWVSLGLSETALIFGDLPASGAYGRHAASGFVATGDRWGAT
jgi:hypothetical protein